MIYALLTFLLLALSGTTYFFWNKAKVVSKTLLNIQYATQMPIERLNDLRIKSHVFDTFNGSLDVFFANAPDDLRQEVALTVARYIAGTQNAWVPLLASKRDYLDGFLPEDELIQQISTAVEEFRFPFDPTTPITSDFPARLISLEQQIYIAAAGVNGAQALASTCSKANDLLGVRN